MNTWLLQAARKSKTIRKSNVGGIMRNTFFSNIKKALIASTVEAHSAAIEKNPGANTLTGIQSLSVKEYSAVAGGPQVENEPEG